MKILQSRSIRGLSVVAFELETIGYTIALAYCLPKGLPFSTDNLGCHLILLFTTDGDQVMDQAIDILCNSSYNLAGQIEPVLFEALYSWFRYRENALRTERMNMRDETYAAIGKMVATLDDPFTRFLEPERFWSLRSGTGGALTGVGLSIGYPNGSSGLPSGLVVISAAPAGPVSRAGIISGDVILQIDKSSTEHMGIYKAAELLQGPEGSMVELTVPSGLETKQLSLMRERVSLNPVKSRLCEIPGLGKDSPRIGYIKLSSFNQNASGAVKDAIQTFQSNDVNAFVLDLRDNGGGLFPEGVEIAKLWGHAETLARGDVVW